MEKRNLFPTWTTGSAGGRDLGPGPGPGPASTLANVTRSTSTRSTSTRTNSRRRRIMAAASPRAPRLRILIPKNELSVSAVLGPNILVYKVSGFYPVLKLNILLFQDHCIIPLIGLEKTSPPGHVRRHLRI